MSSDAEVRVSVTAEGGDRVLRMLRGISDAAQRADLDATRSSERRVRAQQQHDRASELSTRRAEDARRREGQRTTDEHRRQMQDQTRETERAARDEQRALSQRRRDNRGRFTGGDGGGGGRRRPRGGGGGDFGGDMLGMLGLPTSAAAAGGAGIAAVVLALNSMVQSLGRVTTALESQAGVQDVSQRTTTAADFEAGLVRLGGEVFGQMDPAERQRQLAALAAEINEVARATHQDPGQLLTALQGMQTEFSAFEFGRENLEALGAEATRLNMPVQDLARYVALVNQQMGELDAQTILDITAQGGLRGALDPASLSTAFAGQLGQYSTFVDPNQAATSEERFRGFVATANVLRQSGLGANESATLMQNMFGALINPQNQRRMRRQTGVDIRSFRNEQGTLDLAGYMEALESSGRFDDLDEIGQSIHDQQARQAFNTIMMARRKARQGTGVDIRTLQNVSAAEGGAFRQQNLREVMMTQRERMRGVAVESQIEGFESLQPRSERATDAARIRERLRAQGPIGELLDTDWTTSGIGALMGNNTLRRFMGGQMLGLGIHAQLSGGTSPLSTVAPLLTAVGGAARESEGVRSNSMLKTGDRVNLDDASIDRMAQRFGQEVRRSLTDAPNEAGRTPGARQPR